MESNTFWRNMWCIFTYCVFHFSETFSYETFMLQVNLCQKLLFLHQLTQNMTTDCSLNYKFNTWKFQAQTWGEHFVYRNCFWHSEQFLYTTCSPHVLQKEELLTNIYLYLPSKLTTKHCKNSDFQSQFSVQILNGLYRRGFFQ